MAPAHVSKVLVVDEDSAAVELITSQVLEPLGFRVASASDGNSALQAALRMVPDILITSLDLPGLSGRDLVAALRSQGYETTVIAMGPGGAGTQALSAFRLGARDYLVKPLREAELVASVDRALAEVRLRGERQQLADKLANANERLEKRVNELTTLASIGKAVAAATTVSQLFMRLLEAGMFVTEAQAGWLVVADEPGGEPILRASRQLPNLMGIRLNRPWDDGISSLIMKSGEGITLDGPTLARMPAGETVKSLVAVPLKAKDQVLGVLVSGSKTERQFTERDQAMLAAVADNAATAIVNARLFHNLEARLRQAQQEQADHTLRWQQLQGQLAQASDALERLAIESASAMPAHQADLLRNALKSLAAAHRLAGGSDARAAARPIVGR
jgi:two-component system, NtrC family, sensor kinase